MTEALKKASRKLRGVPEATLVTGDEPFLADLKHVETRVRRNYKPLKDSCPIVCPSCQAKITEKDIQKLVRQHGVSGKALLVDKKGEQNESLRNLYEKIRARKITSQEAFETQDTILSQYRDRFVYPENEQPTSSVSGRVPIKCTCDYLLGSVEVSITAKPETPIAPDVPAWVALKKTPKEERIIAEYLLPTVEGKSVPYEDWLSGKETLPFIEKFENWKKELAMMPFIKELDRPLSDLQGAIDVAVTKIRDEIRTRPDRVYNLLKDLPQTPSQKIED